MRSETAELDPVVAKISEVVHEFVKIGRGLVLIEQKSPTTDGELRHGERHNQRLPRLAEPGLIVTHSSHALRAQRSLPTECPSRSVASSLSRWGTCSHPSRCG